MSRLLRVTGQNIPSPTFCRSGYRSLIETLIAHGYRATTFANARKQQRDLIVRHDVDVCLEAAVNIARIEHDLAIRATYFIMVSNSFYNIYSYEGRRLVDSIQKLGHYIGLHFDPSPYIDELDRDQYSEAVAHERRLLAAIVDNPLDIISFHNPPREMINRERPEGSPPHTYEPRFFTEFTYVPDSGGSWRFGGPFERPAFARGTAIHLLTHPVWWDHDEPTASPAATLDKFVTGYRGRLEDSLSRGFKDYRQLLIERKASEGAADDAADDIGGTSA